MQLDDISAAKLKTSKPDSCQDRQTDKGVAEETDDIADAVVEGEKVETTRIERNAESTIHTGKTTAVIQQVLSVPISQSTYDIIKIRGRLKFSTLL